MKTWDLTAQTFGHLKHQKELFKEEVLEVSDREGAIEIENKPTAVIMAVIAIKEDRVREIIQEEIQETVREDIVMEVVNYHMVLEALEEDKIFTVGIEWPIGMQNN